MAEGGKKDEYDFRRPEDDLEWWAEMRMNIREVRMQYSSISHYMNIWPGPRTTSERPKDEMDFLKWYQGRLFAMIADYNFTHHEVEEGVDDTTPSGDDT